MSWALACACSFSFASPVSAQPSIWDSARDPKSRRDYETLVGVERMLSREDESMAFDPAFPERLMRAALAVVELGSGKDSRDARLLFLAGDLLSDPLLGRDEDAKNVLERALARDPESPLAGRAWFNLAIGAAKVSDPKREHHAYSRALESVWEPGFRANIYANRGESSMVLGDLEAAIRDYRKSIALADRPDLVALSQYGLGIAYERNGDLPRGLEAMAVARAIQIPGIGSALDLPSVFFVPPYDIHYYKALSAMSAARRDAKPESLAIALLEAAEEWQKYLEPASADRHRWVPNAKRHQRTVLERLKRLTPEIKRRAAASRQER
ncbi:MAG: tetratricopeptide repeat protein [Polyangiaceae bacterium]